MPRTTVVLLFGVGLAFLAAGARPDNAVAAASFAPQVSLPEHATLQEAVRSLQQAGFRVVAADLSAVRPEPVLRNAADAVPLEDALRVVSMTYDRCWLVRGRSLALQRRYSNPEEDPGLEMGELRQATADIYGLIAPYTPDTDGIGDIRAHNAFVASINGGQQQRMLGEGLSFRDLSPAQQAAWLKINHYHAFSDGARELYRAERFMALWGQVTVEDLPLNGRSHFQLACYFPDAARPGGRNSRVFKVALGAGATAQRRRNSPEGMELPAIAAPGSLRQAWSLPVQQIDLGSLIQKLQDTGGPKVEYPTYARQRTFWIGSKGGTRADVLLALADMWGWELAPTEHGYFLGRPHLSPAKDVVELYAKLRHALPPTVRHLIAARSENAWARDARQGELLLEGVSRAVGKDWSRFPPTQLDPDNQRRLANLVVRDELSDWYAVRGRTERPPAWLTSPEQGVFRLRGPLGPDLHPQLDFMMEYQGPDGQKRFNGGWGWAVNTSTLKD